MEWGRGVRVPVIVSAHGPRSLRLGGEIADGVVVGLGVTPEVVRGSLAYIAEGAERAGRSPGDIEVWFTCFWFVDEQPGAALAEGAWAATAFAMHFARGRTEGKFVPDEHRAGIEALGADYDLVAHGRVDADHKRRYVERANELGIGDYIRRRFMFCGTPAEVDGQIREAMAAGARNFDGAIDADLDEHRVRITKWANLVLPRFRDPVTERGRTAGDRTTNEGVA
jgi:5,10-methylenetetrahydromethanopterin reductase